MDALVQTLIARILFLQHQLDQSVFHEAAVIATLKELLPGFAPRYDQLRKTAEKTFSPHDPQALAALEQALKDAKNRQT